jgi:small acid-soluble spore protein A (major alpha-type SASP)
MAGGGGGGGSRRSHLVESAQYAMEQLKTETATELGITNYQTSYKGDLPSRVNGSVGGYMVKKMVALAEQTLASSSGTTGTTSR